MKAYIDGVDVEEYMRVYPHEMRIREYRHYTGRGKSGIESILKYYPLELSFHRKGLVRFDPRCLSLTVI